MVLSSRGGVVGGGGNTRIAYGSYTGTGQSGESHPNALTFEFKPVAVFIGGVGTTESEGFPGMFIRGLDWGHSCTTAGGGGYAIMVSWTDSGLSWYSTANQYHQMNGNNVTYYYVALGDDSE